MAEETLSAEHHRQPFWNTPHDGVVVTPEPHIVIETITPQHAAELLGVMGANRNKRLPMIRRYARDMAKGRWALNGETIKISQNGVPIDGQHRLEACILADVAFTTAVAYNVDDAAHYSIDTGMKRTASDELAFRDEGNSRQLAAVLGLLWSYERRSVGDRYQVPSTQEVVEFLDSRPEVRPAVITAGRVTHHIPVARTPFAATLALLQRQHDEEIAEAFAMSVQTGAGCVEGDAVLALRQYAINIAGQRRVRPDQAEWFAICIKGANAWLQRRPLRYMTWRRFGPKPEPFPQLIEG